MDLKPLIPFEPINAERAPDDPQWIAQIKWDGVRMLTYYDGREARLFNRKRNERTLQYPELLDVPAYCSASSVILDGEIVAFDQSRPSFHEVMRRDSLRKSASVEQVRKRVPVSYMVFDILYCNGRWTLDDPLAERQRLLQQVLLPSELVQPVANYADGDALLQVMEQHGMEGIVCKDLQGRYALDGKDGRWRKIKLMRDLNAVVGGVTFRDRIVNALLLGLYDEQGRLFYIGHAGTGKLTVQDWRELTARVSGLARSERPFANVPERHKEAVWLEPELKVKVRFLEWTPGGTMRHPSIQARVDVPAAACTFSQSP